MLEGEATEGARGGIKKFSSRVVISRVRGGVLSCGNRPRSLFKGRGGVKDSISGCFLPGRAPVPTYPSSEKSNLLENEFSLLE